MRANLYDKDIEFKSLQVLDILKQYKNKNVPWIDLLLTISKAGSLKAIQDEVEIFLKKKPPIKDNIALLFLNIFQALIEEKSSSLFIKNFQALKVYGRKEEYLTHLLDKYNNILYKLQIKIVDYFLKNNVKPELILRYKILGLQKIKKYPKALEECNKLLDILKKTKLRYNLLDKKEYFEVLRIKLGLLQNNKKWNDIIRIAKEALDLAPDYNKKELDTISLVKVGALRELGKFNEALIILDNLTKVYGYGISIVLEKAKTLKAKYGNNKADNFLNEITNKSKKIFPQFLWFVWMNEYLRIDKNFQYATKILKKIERLDKKKAVIGAAYNTLVDVYIKEKKFIEALKIIDTALRKFKSDKFFSYDFLESKALCLKEMKKYKESLDIFNTLLKKYPKNAFFLKNKGIILYNLKKNSEAEKYLIKSKKIYPKDEETLRFLGNIHLEEYELIKALEFYNKTLSIKLDDDKALKNKTIVLMLLGRNHEAIQLIKDILKKKKEEPEIIAWLGDCYFSMKEYDKAIKYYKISLKKKPNNLVVLSAIGGAYINKNDYANALKYINRALSKNPNHIVALINKGISFGRKGQHKEALKFFRKTHKLAPNDKNILSNYATALDLSHKNKELIKIAEKLLKLDKNNADGLGFKAFSLFRLSKYKEAMNVANAIINRYPKQHRAIFLKAHIYSNLKKYDKAEFYFKKYLKRSPDDKGSLDLLGSMYSKQKEYKKMFEVAKRLYRLDPKHPLTLRNLGYSYYELKKYKQALFYARKALRIEPKLIEAIDDISMIMYKLDRYQESLVYAKKLLKLKKRSRKSVTKFIDKIKKKIRKNAI